MQCRGNREKLGAAAAMMVLFWMCGCASLQTTSTEQQPVVAKEQPKAAPAPALVPSAVPVNVPYLPPPNSMDLCGEPVPLDRQDVYERFDREFTLVVYNHAQVYLWLKRMERYFPTIEQRLRYYDLPDDLKYVAIVESDLLPNACSPKGAAGPWQFMRSTGAAYGLDQKGSVDKRYDFERSTDSAFLLLKDLYKKYHNWSLAIAAYNCGDRRILDESRIQGVHRYYDLMLPQETERYVFRILAVKAVLSMPDQYGYELPKGWGYQELQSDHVAVSLSRPVPIQTIANAAGTTYREVKRLNPIFRSDDIPAGNHEIKLPLGAGKVFEQNFRSGSPLSVMTASTEGPMDESLDSPASPAPAVTRSAAPAPSRSATRHSSSRKGLGRAKQKTTKLSKAGPPPRGKLKTGSAKTGSHVAKQRTKLAKAGPPGAKHKTSVAKAGSKTKEGKSTKSLKAKQKTSR